jgi:antitoxin MazE
VLVSKWGNSLAVRLPAMVVKALGLKDGDEIDIHVANPRDFTVGRKPGSAELLTRLHAFRERLPADFKFDRDEPVRDGAWRTIVPSDGAWNDFFDTPGIDLGRRDQPPAQKREAF